MECDGLICDGGDFSSCFAVALNEKTNGGALNLTLEFQLFRRSWQGTSRGGTPSEMPVATTWNRPRPGAASDDLLRLQGETKQRDLSMDFRKRGAGRNRMRAGEGSRRRVGGCHELIPTRDEGRRGWR
ncbi:hypothetical protein LXL04_023331 [Taraxacum kok-saghyz]